MFPELKKYLNTQIKMALHNPRKTNGNIFILQGYRKQILRAFRQKEANYLARMKIALTLGFSATRSEDNLTTSNSVFRENVGNNVTLKNSIIFQGNSIYFQTCKALHHRPFLSLIKKYSQKSSQNEELSNEEIMIHKDL